MGRVPETGGHAIGERGASGGHRKLDRRTGGGGRRVCGGLPVVGSLHIFGGNPAAFGGGQAAQIDSQFLRQPPGKRTGVKLGFSCILDCFCAGRCEMGIRGGRRRNRCVFPASPV